MDNLKLINMDLSNLILDKTKKSFFSKLYFKIIDLF